MKQVKEKIEVASLGYLNQIKLKKAREQKIAKFIKENFSLKNNFLLEIGSGHGHWLTNYALTYAKKDCIGIDLINKRIEKANNKKSKKNLRNVHFIIAEANEFLNSLPNEFKCDNVVFLFPDPWPKKRHYKNRIMQASFLEKLARIMTNSGMLYFRTDNVDYFKWTSGLISSSKCWQIKEAPWLYESETYFQNINKTYESLVASVKLY